MEDAAKERGISRRGFLPGAMAAGTAVLAGGGMRALGQTQAASKYPVLDTVEVLVVGAGPAGIGAALGAARTGANTLLVENCSFFGGVAAWSLGMQLNQMRPEGKPRSVVHELVIDKLKAYGDQSVKVYSRDLVQRRILESSGHRCHGCGRRKVPGSRACRGCDCGTQPRVRRRSLYQARPDGGARQMRGGL